MVGIIAVVAAGVVVMGGRRAERRLKHLDTNGDGKVSLAEFQAKQAKRFRKLDADGNGSVSKAELAKGRHHGRRGRFRRKHHGRRDAEENRGTDLLETAPLGWPSLRKPAVSQRKRRRT